MPINQENLTKDMRGVIASSQLIRDTLLDPEKTQEEKQSKLELFKTALSANKSIVAAHSTMLTAEKIING